MDARGRRVGPGATGVLRRLRDRDHTQGGLLSSLLVLSLPMLATSGVTLVFQVFDLAFLSRLGEAPMASVIIVNQTVRQGLVMLMVGVAFGTQALIARAVGAGRGERAEHLAGQVVLIGGVFSVAVATVGLFVAPPLFALTGAEPAFAPYGIPYLQLTLVLAFGFAATHLFAAILAGAGDTTTPFLVTAVQTVVAILAEWILIFGKLGVPALGVRGAALGVGIGHVVGVTLALRVLFRGHSRVHLRRRRLAPDPAALREILRLSWPPAIQMGTRVLVVGVFLHLAASFGESVQAAYAVGLRIGMFVPMVCFPLAGAVSTLVGQALGAGDVARAWRAVGVGLLVNCSIMWSFALLILLFRRPIMQLLSGDPEVIAVGAEYLLYLSGTVVAWSFYFVFLRALQGAGDMLVPMLISVSSSLFVAIPLAIGLSQATGLGRQGIWTAFLVNSVVSTLGTALRVASGGWTRRPPAGWGGTAPV